MVIFFSNIYIRGKKNKRLTYVEKHSMLNTHKLFYIKIVNNKQENNNNNSNNNTTNSLKSNVVVI